MICIKTGINIGYQARNETLRGDLHANRGVAVANCNPSSVQYHLEGADILILDEEALGDFGTHGTFVFFPAFALPLTEIGHKALAEVSATALQHEE